MFQPVKLSQDSFVKIFQLLPCPAGVSTFHAGSILEVNDAFCDTFGYTPEEVKGASALELGLWFDTKDREQAINILRQTGSLHNFETRFRKKDNSIIWISFNAEILEVDGVKFLLIVMMDISHQKMQS